MLLVEDDVDHRLIASHHLKKLRERHGGVFTAESLQEARAVLDNQPVELVLMDLTLPDSSLEETLTALRDLSETHPACFVALSSLGTLEVAERAVGHGASAFIAKQDISTASLGALLDELEQESPASTEPESEPSPSQEITRGTDQPDTGSQSPVIRSGALGADPKSLASKIAHDALSWATNISFRASAVARDPAVAASEKLSKDMASIRESTDALTSFVSGARTLLATELAIGEIDPTKRIELDLSIWLSSTVERWKKVSRDKRLSIHIDCASKVSVPEAGGERLFAQSLTSLLRNIVQHAPHHAQQDDGKINVTLREISGDGSQVALELTDEGGPWQVEDASILGTPMGTGTPKAPQAGLGLYAVCRCMEALGGQLQHAERGDAEGAFATILRIPRAGR